MSRNFSTVALVLSLTACTSVPELPPEYALTVSDIVNNVRCELKRSSATVPYFSRGDGWTAGTDVSLQVVEDATFGLNASAQIPLNPGALTVAIGGGYQGTADRTVNLTFKDQLQNPESISCAAELERGGTDAKLTGDLGIIRWLSNLQATIEHTGAPVKASTYTLKFTIKRSANGKATFSAIPIGTPILAADVGLDSSRSNVHTLVVTFSVNEPTTKKILVNGKVVTKKIVPAISNEQRNQNEQSIQILRTDN